MAELTVPQIDFSSLGQLPEIYRQGQANALRQQTLASLGQGGPADAAALLKSGDLSLAQLGINLQTKQSEDAWRREEATRAQKNSDRSYGLQVRSANRADDPTPTGFAKQPDGTYAPLQGGPQDPAYQARLAAEAARAKGDVPTIMGVGSSVIIPNKAADGAIFTNRPADTGLSDASRDIKARQIINGDYSGLQNIGRGAQAGKTLEAVSNRAAEILMEEQGMSSADAAAHLGKKVQEFKASSMGQGAEARTAGVREANLNLILRAADAAIPAALEASDKVARTGWVPLNQIIQKGEVVSSNPDLKRFGMANLQLAEHWARAMNPTGVMRESDRDKALSFLSTADSQSTYRAAVDQLHTQIVRERDAVKGAPVTPSAPSFRSDTQPAPPQVGQLMGGYRYKGGNPADPASWVQSQ